MTERQQKIQDLLAHASADIAMCNAAYDIIDKAPIEEKPGLFEEFAVGYGNTPTDNTRKLPRFMGAAGIGRLTKRYYLHVEALMVALLDMDLPKADFYRRLWTYLSVSPSLPTRKARVFALYSCVCDVQLPYYPIDRTTALTMSTETFENHTAAIGDEKLGRMRFLLSATFKPRLERASLLLQEMDSLKSTEEKAVYLTHFITYLVENPYRKRPRDLFELLSSAFSISELFGAWEDDCVEISDIEET